MPSSGKKNGYRFISAVIAPETDAAVSRNSAEIPASGRMTPVSVSKSPLSKIPAAVCKTVRSTRVRQTDEDSDFGTAFSPFFRMMLQHMLKTPNRCVISCNVSIALSRIL